MEHQVTISIEFMMRSHYELARILEAKKHAATHVSRVICGMPERPAAFGDGEAALELALEVTQSIAAYLSSLGDLEEAIADQLEIIMAELNPGEGGE